MSLNKYAELLEKSFQEYKYGDSPQELYEPIDYIMSLGGKRLRPLLTLVTANLFTSDWQAALKPAMGLEVFHNFTLMHDDIMDNAPARRGKLTVHLKWDINRAILSGDVMLVAAYELMSEANGGVLREVLKRFNKTAAEVCEGQQLDMLFAEKPEVSKEDYLEMIRLKTSVLVGFAMELGGIVAGESKAVCTQLFKIGENLGLGFQQMDDVLDVYADPKKFGKQVGGDIIENKRTWLLLRALEKAEGTPLEKELIGWFSVSDPEKKVAGVRNIYDTLNIKEEATALAKVYFDRAEKGIQKLKARNNESLGDLMELVNLIRNRNK